MTQEQVIRILKDVDGALSHASYCAITGAKVNHEAVSKASDRLRMILEELAPEPDFSEHKQRPVIMIVPYKERES